MLGVEGHVFVGLFGWVECGDVQREVECNGTCQEMGVGDKKTEWNEFAKRRRTEDRNVT